MRALNAAEVSPDTKPVVFEELKVPLANGLRVCRNPLCSPAKNGACANQVFRCAPETVKSVRSPLSFIIRDFLQRKKDEKKLQK